MRNVISLLAAAVALVGCLAAPSDTTVHHDEALHGDLLGDPNAHAFDLVPGVNEWRGVIEPTPSSQHDRWTVTLPTDHEITDVTFSRGSTGGDGSVVRFLFGNFMQDFVDEAGETVSFVPPATGGTATNYGVQIITDFNTGAPDWTVTITVAGPAGPSDPS